MHLQTFISKMPKFHLQRITDMVLYTAWPGGESDLDIIPRRDRAQNSGCDGQSDMPHTLSIIPK